MDSKAAPGQDRKKVSVSVLKGTQLRESYQEFNNLVQKSHQQFNSSQQDTYYMISSKWLKQLQEFCEQQKPQRYQPSLYNSDLLESDGKTLRKGLSEGADFEIVSTDAFELLNNFKGHKLLRKARMVGHEKRVQIYLSTFKVLDLAANDLKEIDRKGMSKEQLKKRLRDYQQSEQATISQFCQSLSSHLNLSSSSKTRLWRLDKDTTLDILYNHIITETKPIMYSSDYKIKFLGKRIEEEDCKLCDLNLVDGDYFVLQHKSYSKDWYLQSDSEGKCQNCYQIRKLQFPCGCKKVAYCTQLCKEKDKRYHLSRCSFAQQEQLNKKVEMKLTQNSSRGLTGLTNLGNTCFMNSCLQSLSHTLPLTYYFINGYFEDQINKENPLGSKGKLAKAYAKFIKGVWCDQDSTFSPYSLKSAVGSINPIFSGYAQHDSQEFFSFLIDGLNQDLNRIGKKPYVESVESKGRADKIVALQSWISHIRRYQSIIVDLMTGQYKSKVICPDCQFQSITFDPFITVTLPIPQQTTSKIDFFAIHHNFEKQTKKMSFVYKKPSKEQWESKGAQLLGIEQRLVSFYVVTMHEAIYKLGKISVNDVVNKVQNESKNLFLLELSQQQSQFKQSIQFTTRCSKKSNYYDSFENLWFKFPLLFQRSKVDGLAIYKRILKFLYNQAYDKSTRKTAISGKTYQQYEKIMLKNRPFQLVLRYQKKVEKYYHRTEYKFESEKVIKDESSIQQILNGTSLEDCELDARFNKEGIRDYTFEQLKHFKDTNQKYSRRNQANEDATVTLQQCLDNLRQPQKLQQGNEWYCPKCKDHKQATKEIDIYKAPKILILHLKRFKQKGNYRKEKNQSKVIFPMNFDFSPYLIDPTPMNTYTEEAIKQNIYIKPSYEEQKMAPEKAEYELYAVSNHFGGLGGGHYTAYAKNNGKWYEFNDSSVRSCSESSVCSSGAYILFYKRKD